MDKYEIIFESENIYYIKITKLLINDYLKMINSKDVSKFITLKERTLSYEDETEWIEKTLNAKALIYSMIEKSSEKYIGNIGITEIKDNNCKIAISITPSMQDKHYGTEGLTRLIEYIQNDLKFDNIELEVFSNNLRGIHLYNKLGFKEYKREKIENKDIEDIYMRYENKLDKYLNQDIFNPKYLFHGSPYLLEELEPKKSADTINKDNEDTAIFLTSWFLNASAYAFRNKLKEYNEFYNFSINNDGKLPVMKFEVDTIPDDLYGYIYVFEKNNDIVRDDHGNINRKTTQYKCHNKLKPIDVIKINFKDYEKYFELNKKYIKK